ncbi:MAG TPA: LCP family protein [Candidatus Limnocylindrales bacterium]|nr:LCP family protein [Candidatus Limnocylindrales bacterium]
MPGETGGAPPPPAVVPAQAADPLVPPELVEPEPERASTSVPAPVATGALPRSATIAAVLGFLFPGAGHAWAGRAMRAAVLGLPALFLIGVPIGLYLAGGTQALVALVTQPSVLLGILTLDIVLLVWRTVSIVDAYAVARRAERQAAAADRPRRQGSRLLGKAVVVTLVAVTIGTHGAVAFVGYNGYDLVTGVFAQGDGTGVAWGDEDPSYSPEPEETDDPGATPDPLALQSATPSPTATPSASPSPTITPEPLPYWAEDGRLNLVLLGGDSGPGRASIRTDTMMLLSVDLASHKAVLASFPRNLVNVPLPKPYSRAFANGRYPEMLNALWRYADEHPSKRFPGGDRSRGFRAVSAAIGYMAGVEVDGLAFVDLNGFVKFIDVLGGLDITVPEAIYDARYPMEDGSGNKVLRISAGKHHLNGSEALAYARSRHQDSDYGRMSRQQLVLLALRKQTKVCSLVPDLPKLVKIAKSSMYTNIPLNDLPPLMAVAAKVRSSSIEQLSFTPGEGYPSSVTTSAVLRMRKAIRNALESTPKAPPRPTPIPSLAPGATPPPPSATPEEDTGFELRC